jgi:hypothetical protein
MTYEQLLELQEQVGHVENGFTKRQIEVGHKNIIYLIYLIFS